MQNNPPPSSDSQAGGLQLVDRMPLRPPDEELQKFVQQVATRCQTPIALVSLLDEKQGDEERTGLAAAVQSFSR